MTSKKIESRQQRQKSLPAIVISGLPHLAANSSSENSTEECSEPLPIITEGACSTPIDSVRFRPKSPKSITIPDSPPESILETPEDDQFNSSQTISIQKKTPAFMQSSGRRRMSEYGTGATGLLGQLQKPTIRIIPLDKITGEPGNIEEAIDGDQECPDGEEEDANGDGTPPPHFSREDLDRYDGLPNWAPGGTYQLGRRASCAPFLTGSESDIDEQTGEELRKRRANNRLLSVEASLGSFRPFATAVGCGGSNVRQTQPRSSSTGTPPLRRIQSFDTKKKNVDSADTHEKSDE